MEYRTLGRTGLKVSGLCLGTASFGVAPAEGEVSSLVQRALDVGINFIDTANTYGNQSRFDREGAPSASERRSAEELVGKAIAGRRDQVVLASKVSEAVGDGPNDGGFGGGGLSRVHIMRQVEQSLNRLGTDYLDIYYAHHPDSLTDPREWITTFDDLVKQGKIRYYALSTFTGWELTEAVLTADAIGASRPACHQTRYSVAKKWAEAEVLPACQRLGISTTVFSPLGGGLLTGVSNTRRYAGNARWGGAGFSAEEVEIADQFARYSKDWEIEPTQLALAWLLSQPGVASAIVGPETATELDMLSGAVDLELTTDQIGTLNGLAATPVGQWD